MKKNNLFLLIPTFILFFLQINTNLSAQNFKEAYFAGGCFWCMEESFEKTEGIISVISGYSGGTKENPTYKEVTYGNSGHFETIKVIFDSEKIGYKNLLNVYWKNIDPFDAEGQFCDKGYSYRSVVFYKSSIEKNIIDQSIKNIETKFNKKIVTYVRKFDKFYEAESNHQDYYNENFINYLMYKKECRRTETLNKIWN